MDRRRVPVAPRAKSRAARDPSLRATALLRESCSGAIHHPTRVAARTHSERRQPALRKSLKSAKFRVFSSFFSRIDFCRRLGWRAFGMGEHFHNEIHSMIRRIAEAAIVEQIGVPV